MNKKEKVTIKFFLFDSLVCSRFHVSIFFEERRDLEKTKNSIFLCDLQF